MVGRLEVAMVWEGQPHESCPLPRIELWQVSWACEQDEPGFIRSFLSHDRCAVVDAESEAQALGARIRREGCPHRPRFTDE